MKNKIKIIPIESLTANTWNPNTMQEKDFIGLRRSVLEFGGNVSNPILVRKKGSGYEIIDGEQRFNAMKSVGFDQIAVIILDVDDAEARIRTIAMNKLRGSIDEVKMASLITELQTTYMMSEQEIEESLGMTEEDLEESNELSEIELIPDDIDIVDEVSDGVTIKLELTPEELEVVYGLAESLGVDVKSLILRAVAESTRYLNEGLEMAKTVAVSDVQPFDIVDVNF